MRQSAVMLFSYLFALTASADPARPPTVSVGITSHPGWPLPSRIAIRSVTASSYLAGPKMNSARFEPLHAVIGSFQEVDERTRNSR